MRNPGRLLTALAATIATLVAAPALAYTIYLKDGSQIVSKTKYVVRGDKAIIVLPSGTETQLPFAPLPRGNGLPWAAANAERAAAASVSEIVSSG